MKKSKLFKTLMALLSCGTILCGCNTSTNTNSQVTPDVTGNSGLNAETSVSETSTSVSESTLYTDFSQGPSNLFEASNGWTNGGIFNCIWRDTNCTFENGALQITIGYNTGEPALPYYSSGEYRTRNFYGYGKYEVSMKPAKNDGIATTFIVYTGPYDGNPWDEVDIQFLGKDTTIVQFNYFSDSFGEHEYIYELGFDASEAFHTYAFEWHKDKIVWFVDGQEVYTATDDIPCTPGKIMLSSWPGVGVDSWLNAFNDSNLPITSEYRYVAFTPFNE